MSNAPTASFATRHIGLRDDDIAHMLSVLKLRDMPALLDEVIPRDILRRSKFDLPAGISEEACLEELSEFASQNQRAKSYIGMGYYGCHVPSVIRRNVLENPAWYTAYTPYQPEISQGRLEAILNFQTMVTKLTGMDLANSSLLDEATAAVEAMLMAHRLCQSKSNCFRVDEDTHPQIITLLKTRAQPLGIEVQCLPSDVPYEAGLFGALISYPSSRGEVRDIASEIKAIKNVDAMVIVVSDLLALTLLMPPGALGADIVIGSAQRFGVPFGFGGPHAAFFATKSAYQRSVPGRLVGVSKDRHGQPAYRLALQTREQHIRREKATSNICTAQVLLAVMSSFYALWHGPEGLQSIALHSHNMARHFAAGVMKAGWSIRFHHFFDTIVVETKKNTDVIFAKAQEKMINLRQDHQALIASFDETSTEEGLVELLALFDASLVQSAPLALSKKHKRHAPFMTQDVFHLYRTETEMMRYMRQLADKDLALDRCMIPLGSCTMKLNAATEMIPVTWPEFADIHPFAPAHQTAGYRQMIASLEEMLACCTGYDAISLQPNSGAQGELTGLLAIAAYHRARGEGHRHICLIPHSAHGTNPASAVLAGMRVVVVKCDDRGDLDRNHLDHIISQYDGQIAAMMVTYPSTHGVFEEHIKEICDKVHDAGGQVYVDGANLNALVGHCSLPEIGADVSHLNLHKTFCIPHGGGGPGVGPIGVVSHLAPFLPKNPLQDDFAVSASEFGSAGILPITYAYIRMMGKEGLTNATSIPILSANYIAARLSPYFPILYTGVKGRVAHECIIDIRPLSQDSGVTNEDVAKRLIDYGFHAPTMSFPVAGTLMIEPTESESLAEIDRFCQAMIKIADEIKQIISAHWPRDDNPLVNAPHTVRDIISDDWAHPYSRDIAAAGRLPQKYWPPVGRVDNAYGDRHLICSCPTPEEWAALEQEAQS